MRIDSLDEQTFQEQQEQIDDDWKLHPFTYPEPKNPKACITYACSSSTYFSSIKVVPYSCGLAHLQLTDICSIPSSALTKNYLNNKHPSAPSSVIYFPHVPSICNRRANASRVRSVDLSTGMALRSTIDMEMNIHGCAVQDGFIAVCDAEANFKVYQQLHFNKSFSSFAGAPFPPLEKLIYSINVVRDLPQRKQQMNNCIKIVHMTTGEHLILVARNDKTVEGLLFPFFIH